MNFIFDNMLTFNVLNWIGSLLNYLFMFIDIIVYQLLASMYTIFMAIAKMQLTDFDTLFDNLVGRIYLLLGLLMLFKISFSLLSMLAHPEKAKDSNQGGYSIAKHIFLSLVMLVASPFVFQLFGNAQTAIIESHVLEKLILGGENTDLTGEAAGPSFSWNLFSSFYYPKDGAWANISGNLKTAYDGVYVYDETTEANVYSLWPLYTSVNDVGIVYNPIISTIVGIGIMIYIIKFAFDIGIRAFKLLFLQIIAPIPIISYMDPGKGKDIFNKYVSTFISTYVDLFIRLGIIFLAILLSNVVMTSFAATEGSTLFESSNLTGLSLILAKVVIIVAIYQFAIQVPKMLESIFGFNMTAITSLRSLGSGNLGKAAALGGAGIIGTGIGTAGSLGSSLLRGDFKNEDGKLSAGGVGKTITNALHGGARTGLGAAQSGLKTGIGRGTAGAFSKSIDAGIRKQGISSEASRAAGGIGNLTKGRLDNALGGEYRAKKSLNASQGQLKNLNAQKELSQKNLTGSQNRMQELASVRGTITNEFANAYGVEMSEAQKYMRENPDEINAYISEFGTTNESIKQSVEDFNFNHSDEPINISDPSFDYRELETASREGFVEAREEFRSADEGVRNQEAEIKNMETSSRSQNREAARNADSNGGK